MFVPLPISLKRQKSFFLAIHLFLKKILFLRVEMTAFIHSLVLASFWWHFCIFGIMRPKSRQYQIAKMQKLRHLWSLMMTTFES